ncbi:hypothetical protein DKX38_029682 [Salix brachista]|uniref:Uncharacterized protein n=1 Tax=Salix brachista TaxID=2182728 RepID=A0A5N5J444_9ROSI|nr:hypothetical protein DKX38_029682 [Salix brachista]
MGSSAFLFLWWVQGRRPSSQELKQQLVKGSEDLLGPCDVDEFSNHLKNDCKASVLAGDVSHLKEPRRKAAEGSEGLFMPLDVDEELSIRLL